MSFSYVHSLELPSKSAKKNVPYSLFERGKIQQIDVMRHQGYTLYTTLWTIFSSEERFTQNSSTII